MSRPWRFAVAAAHVVFTLALGAGLYFNISRLGPAAPSPAVSPVALPAPVAPAPRADGAPAAPPPSPLVEPRPAAPSTPPSDVVFGAPADLKPSFVAPIRPVASPAAPTIAVAPILEGITAATLVDTTPIEIAQRRGPKATPPGKELKAEGVSRRQARSQASSHGR